MSTRRREQLARESVECPTDSWPRGCGAVAGAPCTYLAPPPGTGATGAPAQLARLERTGKPMTSVHAVRLNTLYAREVRRARAQRVPLPTPTERARIALALTTYDRREHAAVATWLASGGADLLIGTGQ